ncbi:hypothetical protein PtA15_1A1031, partial [Puccinia triticina]
MSSESEESAALEFDENDSAFVTSDGKEEIGDGSSSYCPPKKPLVVDVATEDKSNASSTWSDVSGGCLIDSDFDDYDEELPDLDEIWPVPDPLPSLPNEQKELAIGDLDMDA